MEANLRSPIGKLKIHSRCQARRENADDGFTLIEVLVALAILGVSLATLLGVFSQSLEYTSRTRIETEARTLAQSLLAETGDSAQLQIGETSGSTSSGLFWRVLVRPYDREPQNSWPVEAVTVIALVAWTESGRQKTLALDTLRLMPKAPAS
ncbi:MAG TPA: type II secretion system protein [Rhizomicrobium sp.]|nr:type II secretion system protein [Rhizomicrobium sp.]